MRNLLWMIAGILLALWLLSIAITMFINLIGWVISIAPLVALILIIAGFFVGRKNKL